MIILNDEIDDLCSKECDNSFASENIPVNHCNTSISSKMFTFDDDPLTQCRPMTAPNPTTFNDNDHYLSSIDNNIKTMTGAKTKKPFLKRKKRPKLSPKKVDWSYVKPRTISRLSEDVRASRNINNHRSHYKPNAINWKERVSSRVDCGNKVPFDRKKLKQRKKQSSFGDTYHHSVQTQKYCRKNDNYLYYLKKGNKIGKITKDTVNAQLQDGSGSMILKSNSNNDNIEEYDQCEAYDQYDDSADNKLRELQQTFAAIEKAMKQRRRHNQHLQTD